MTANATKRKAFTLVEVMIAVGILSISLTALVALLSAISTKVAEVRSQSKAISLVGDLEVTLKSKSFEEVYRWVRNPRQPYVIYFWDEYSQFNEADDPSLVTLSSETPGKRKNSPPDKQDIQNSEGPVYRVLLSISEDSLMGRHVSIDNPELEYGGGALPESPDSYGEAFIPIKVQFLIDPPEDIINGAGNEDINRQRMIHTDLTIKMR